MKKTLTPQQREFWAELSQDWEYFVRRESAEALAHRFGRVLQGKNEDVVARVLNRHVPLIRRRRFSKRNIILIMKLWLTEYELHLNPGQMTWYDWFHRTHGKLVMELGQTGELKQLEFGG